MNPSEHLTENQLNDYLGNSALDKNEKHRTGRHLLQCDFCLKRLPQPTPQQFWAALMTDNNCVDDSRDDKATLAAWLDSIVESLKQPKILVWGASALAICLFVTAFFWFDTAKSFYAEKEVAQSFEVIETQSVPHLNGGNNQNLPPTFPNSDDGDGNSPPSQNVESKLPISGSIKSDNRPPARIASGQNLPISVNAQPRAISKAASRKSDTSDATITNVSSTRGGAVGVPKCSELLPLDLATGVSNEGVLLKWKKVPNAAKYHIYISDEEEILVDEFETVQETTYALKKPLAPQKTYQWKVVITLEDGKTIIGDSQKFTVKDLQSNQKRSDRKKGNAIRCSESKLNR